MTELEQAQYQLMQHLENLLSLLGVELAHMLTIVEECRRAQKRVYAAQFNETCAANAALEEMLDNG
jgi:hypothetical protein